MQLKNLSVVLMLQAITACSMKQQPVSERDQMPLPDAGKTLAGTPMERPNWESLFKLIYRSPNHLENENKNN